VKIKRFLGNALPAMVKDSSAYIELKSFTNITTLKSPTRVQTAYTAK
jgi:hypothetical protein